MISGPAKKGHAGESSPTIRSFFIDKKLKSGELFVEVREFIEHVKLRYVVTWGSLKQTTLHGVSNGSATNHTWRDYVR